MVTMVENFTSKGRKKIKENINGRMEVNMLVNFKTEKCMVLE